VSPEGFLTLADPINLFTILSTTKSFFQILFMIESSMIRWISIVLGFICILSCGEPKEYTLAINFQDENTQLQFKSLPKGTLIELDSLPFPKRKNYRFLGWSTNSTGDILSSDEPYRMPNQQVILYAQWEQKENELSLDLDGGIGDKLLVGGERFFEEGDSVILPSRDLVYKMDSILRGWKYQDDPLGLVYKPNSTIFVDIRPLRFQAVWAEIDTKIKAVGVGREHFLVLKSDGSCWGYGTNSYGQLGSKNLEDEFAFIFFGIIKIAAGGYHSLFLREDNSLWSLGLNYYGQLGDGTLENRLEPVQVMKDVVDMKAGHMHSLVLKENGELWGFGSYGTGARPDIEREDLGIPFLISKDVKNFDAGFSHTVFVDNNGNLWGAGSNSEGQLLVEEMFIAEPKIILSDVNEAWAEFNATVIQDGNDDFTHHGNGQIGPFYIIRDLMFIEYGHGKLDSGRFGFIMKGTENNILSFDSYRYKSILLTPEELILASGKRFDHDLIEIIEGDE
jgi:uncharacterized repeat protein (TIGR02543 family)